MNYKDTITQEILDNRLEANFKRMDAAARNTNLEYEIDDLVSGTRVLYALLIGLGFFHGEKVAEVTEKLGSETSSFELKTMCISLIGADATEHYYNLFLEEYKLKNNLITKGLDSAVDEMFKMAEEMEESVEKIEALTGTTEDRH